MPALTFCEKRTNWARYCCSSLFPFIARPRQLSLSHRCAHSLLPTIRWSSSCVTLPGRFPIRSSSSAIIRPDSATSINRIIGRSLEPSADTTSPVGYVRLHGRRYDTWFSDNPATPPHERYNYLYSAEELDPWVARIRTIRGRTRETFVITNNHYHGKAVVNALATSQHSERNAR